jgi:hypothetical protein
VPDLYCLKQGIVGECVSYGLAEPHCQTALMSIREILRTQRVSRTTVALVVEHS